MNNEGYESFYQGLKNKGLPDNIIFAIWDNYSSDGKAGIYIMCSIKRNL